MFSQVNAMTMSPAFGSKKQYNDNRYLADVVISGLEVEQMGLNNQLTLTRHKDEFEQQLLQLEAQGQEIEAGIRLLEEDELSKQVFKILFYQTVAAKLRRDAYELDLYDFQSDLAQTTRLRKRAWMRLTQKPKVPKKEITSLLPDYFYRHFKVASRKEIDKAIQALTKANLLTVTYADYREGPGLLGSLGLFTATTYYASYKLSEAGWDVAKRLTLY